MLAAGAKLKRNGIDHQSAGRALPSVPSREYKGCADNLYHKTVVNSNDMRVQRPSRSVRIREVMGDGPSQPAIITQKAVVNQFVNKKRALAHKVDDEGSTSHTQ
jgi:hypothetical protein